ncbi:hypothetical protein JHS3_10380 [Jeongeupia sp. HS-3]|uniref:hypothetical protein n=1 Tax=Jeongeupia sp. HS-3 TaxID=1009682 RepID=UPI0018A5E68E|nr:hypothetical protein [Jeongeupia sp. HS-3]BCL75302.1 hypothetical protein JHS3_10380 [Jeongeupia sp. HS-3]
MRHPDDRQTAELPGLPTTKKRGRPSIGAKAMTSAERKRRSRFNQLQRALQSKDVANTQIPAQLNAVVDESTRRYLVAAAREQGTTVGKLVDQLVAAERHRQEEAKRPAFELVQPSAPATRR